MEVNRDVVNGKWKQINGRIKQRHAALVHNERERVLGWFQLQVGLLQERRGRILARARRGFRRLMHNRRTW